MFLVAWTSGQSLMCLKHSGDMDSVALAAPAGKFWADWKFQGGIPAYYWVLFCIPKIIILPGDRIFSQTYLKVEVMDLAKHSGQNEPKKHVFWIRNEGDAAVLSSAHIVSTWHFQLYTR